jgi:hypothetical protein
MNKCEDCGVELNNGSSLCTFCQSEVNEAFYEDEEN